MPAPAYAGANVSNGNGVTTLFPYNFKILDQTHIEVKIDGLLKVLGTDYTVTGVGLSAGGNVVMGAAPANGTVVQRARKVPFVRTQDYQNNGDFKELTVDNDLDTIEMQVQQVAADTARAFKAPLSVIADQALSDADWAARAGQALGFSGSGLLTLLSQLPAASVTALMSTLLDDATTLEGKATLKIAPPAVNLLPNSDLSICSALPLARVGSPIAIASFAASGVDTGVVVITSADSVVGRAGGITPGKLFLVEGSATPHAPHVALSATVTGNKRITGAAASFAGVEVGDVADLTGGTNTSPRAKYRVAATDANTYVELYGMVSTPLVNEGPLTFDITWYEGSKDVDATMNGMAAGGDSSIASAIGYPLMATEFSLGTFKATLAGKTLNAAGSAAERAWEVTPGDEFGFTGDGADGWTKTTTLRYWRTTSKDWDGVTAVLKDGSAYGCKVKKGAAGAEYLHTLLDIRSPSLHNPIGGGSEMLAFLRGKTITFGMYWWPAGANKARLFVHDGSGFTYGDYFAAGALGWKELTHTIPAAADRVQVGVEIVGAIGDIHYGTQPMAIVGKEIGEGNYTPTRGLHVFATHPNFPSYINAAVPKNALIRIEQESLGSLPRGLQGIFCGLEGQNSAPPTMAAGGTGMAIWDSPSLRLPCITLYDNWGTEHGAFSTGPETVAAGATIYFGFGNSDAGEANSQQIRVPFPFAAINLRIQASTGPVGAETFTYTLRKQNADTALTCSTTGASTQAADLDRAHKVTGNAGDVLTMKVVTSGGAAVAYHNATIELYNTSHVLNCNSGIVAIGKFSESTPTWFSDCMYVQVGESPTSGWNGVNIDMFAAML